MGAKNYNGFFLPSMKNIIAKYFQYTVGRIFGENFVALMGHHTAVF